MSSNTPSCVESAAQVGERLTCDDGADLHRRGLDDAARRGRFFHCPGAQAPTGSGVRWVRSAPRVH